MTRQEQMADLLFPHVTKSAADYEKMFPPRQLKEGARVTRFAPSPTGFMHIGNLFSAFISERTARCTGGVFLIRIEDTDKKREVENGVSAILDGLAAFGITPDEGVTAPGQEQGVYGPYQQSSRVAIYQAIAKELVKKDLAYPCFCTAEELDQIRSQQEENGVNKGYYRQWAHCRALPPEEVQQRLQAGQPFVLRFKSPGHEKKKCFFDDLIKGKIEMPENIQDIVLLKTDGIPTYHFAHVVDDHFMHTTHVVRGDEWISSVPVHLQLFQACGFQPPKYAHIAPIMKEENGGKRKLSKRKDPEAAVAYYAEQGYPAQVVKEYLLTLANSNFEDWRRANQTASQEEFPFNLKKMSVSGALFDLAKLNDISKNLISVMPAAQVLKESKTWANVYCPALFALYEKDETYARHILNIDREKPKPRKDLAKWSDIPEYIQYFYPETYTPCYDLPAHIETQLAAEVLERYLQVFHAGDDKDTWFAKIKSLCPQVGCTPNVKEYKLHPEQFRGHVGDVSTIIRIAITGRQNTPDLHAIIALLGNTEAKKRLTDALTFYRGCPSN